MKIIVDIFGADYSPHEIVKGCVLALEKDPEITLVLSGDQKIIESQLSEYSIDNSRIEILHAPDVVTNNESPTSAIKQKKQSSLVAGLTRLDSDPNCGALVSAGSTGAVLTGAILKIGRISGISRPALAPILPTSDGRGVLLIDSGANVDCKPLFLAHFALMGSAYFHALKGIESPRVGLLSVGVEDHKGNELTKQAFELLSKLPINFKGNMEARDAMGGDFDVIVADGFDGNILLKGVEGAAELILGELKTALYANAVSKMGALLLKKQLMKMKDKLDYTKMGGAALLGVKKVIIKSHGSSKAPTICASILQAKRAAAFGLPDKIKDYLSKVDLSGLED